MTDRAEIARRALAEAEAAACSGGRSTLFDTPAGGAGPGRSRRLEARTAEPDGREAPPTVGPWADAAGAAPDWVDLAEASPAPVEPGPQERRSRGRGGRRRGGRTTEPPPPDPQQQDGEPDPYEVARRIVLNQLTYAPRTRKQLADKLRERGCADDIAEAVLDRMEEVGLVDDEAYAGMLVRSRQAGKGLGRRALRTELRRKGVDDETAQAALAGVSDETERATAYALAEKKLRSMHGLPAQTQVRRLAGMLARKGYGGDLVSSVIREAMAASEEHRRD